MQQQLYAFADEYDSEVDRVIDDHEGQLSINNPLLFVFIGDQSLDVLQAVYDLNTRKWNNSKGVLYLHVYQNETAARDNVFSLRLPAPGSDRKKIRQQLHESFYKDSQVLIDLNRMARQVSDRIAEHGKLYSSFQRLNMAVVTRVDDPCNIMLPEIVILLRTMLGESFKLIQMDMYGLIKEKQVDEFASSLGISFLSELDRMQERTYSFKGKLRVTEDQVKLEVEHAAAPLFDLVYLLSDKNEDGMFPDGGMESNYGIICNMNLLKNMKIVEEDKISRDSYNNQHFRQHIQPAETKEPVYATAGISRVKRPNQAIALTVTSQLYQHILDKLMEQSRLDKRSVTGLLELNPELLDRKIGHLIPPREKLEEMHGILSVPASLSELRRLTLKQAEERLYDRHTAAFFDKNFKDVAEKQLQSMELEQELQELVHRKITNNPIYGLYCSFVWTSDHDERSVVSELQLMGKDTLKRLADAELQLQRLIQEPVETQAFSRFSVFEKTKIKQISQHIFIKVYGVKYDILFLELKMKLIDRYKMALESLNRPLREQIATLQDLDKMLKDTTKQSVSEANDYLGRNIPEYYGTVVKEIVEDLQAKRGERFYFEERYLGNVSQLLEQGGDALLRAIADICTKDLFKYPQFRQSFEDELLQRANVKVRYEDKHKVLSKEELYRDLYVTLEEDAGVRIHVFNYSHKHRYEEKYFYADYESEFMRYAFSRGKGSRMYKLGCVHVKKAVGIEKLNIMGGFQLEDIMYVINGRKYYESYQANGFQFHAIQAVE